MITMTNDRCLSVLSTLDVPTCMPSQYGALGHDHWPHNLWIELLIIIQL